MQICLWPTKIIKNYMAGLHRQQLDKELKDSIVKENKEMKMHEI